MAIRNRFKELLAEKERRQGRRIEYEEIKRETGIAASTLSAWATNQVTRFDANTIYQLIRYFNCDVSDLLVVDDPSNGGNPEFRQEFLSQVAMPV